MPTRCCVFCSRNIKNIIINEMEKNFFYQKKKSRIRLPFERMRARFENITIHPKRRYWEENYPAKRRQSYCKFVGDDDA